MNTNILKRGAKPYQPLVFLNIFPILCPEVAMGPSSAWLMMMMMKIWQKPDRPIVHRFRLPSGLMQLLEKQSVNSLCRLYLISAGLYPSESVGLLFIQAPQFHFQLHFPGKTNQFSLIHDSLFHHKNRTANRNRSAKITVYFPSSKSSSYIPDPPPVK